MSEAHTRCSGGVALVWKGTHFETEGGSDTEESDSEQPLTEPQQVVAILDLKRAQPPPLPAEVRHAPSTAAAVLRHILDLPGGKRTQAHLLALRMPLQPSTTVADWVQQHFSAGRKDQTIKAALCWALNPNRSQAWVCKKVGFSPGQACAAKGLALHLRMHPFTRFEVQHAFGMLHSWSEHRERRLLARAVLNRRFNCGTAALEAAVTLVALQGKN